MRDNQELVETMTEGGSVGPEGIRKKKTCWWKKVWEQKEERNTNETDRRRREWRRNKGKRGEGTTGCNGFKSLVLSITTTTLVTRSF